VQQWNNGNISRAFGIGPGLKCSSAESFFIDARSEG